MAVKLIQLLFWRMRFDLFAIVSKNLDDIEQVYKDMALILLVTGQGTNITQPLACQVVDLLYQMMTKIPGQENLIFNISNAPM